ncbi:DUF3825 domain-containing protein, partial [Ruminococcaceae bacterium OttesenSCG-928-N02]|nr:DUF3825 domain-containing protein [Ruminococcaceae bacterium OttesenSCG-928-N02]
MQRIEQVLIIERIMREMNAPDDGWVKLAAVGLRLNKTALKYKELGFAKLRPFLDTFGHLLEFKEEQVPGKPPVHFVRLREPSTMQQAKKTPAKKEKAAPGPAKEKTPLAKKEAKPSKKAKTKVEKAKQPAKASAQPPATEQQEPVHKARTAKPLPPQDAAPQRRERVPSKDAWLFSWANIKKEERLKELSELALAEKWYYGDAPAQEEDQYPILLNYLTYTFRKLCTEGKVLIEKDKKTGEEYAAFNTGLVDQKYEYIYALFKENTLFSGGYWFLVDFAVAGEEAAGKTLVGLFNPLPAKANYFGGEIANMWYDTESGDLSCDYTHILTERNERLPYDFYEENCPHG